MTDEPIFTHCSRTPGDPPCGVADSSGWSCCGGANGVKLRSEYAGAWGPQRMVVYDRTVLKNNLISAFRDCEFDCGCWSPKALAALADLVLVTLESQP